MVGITKCIPNVIGDVRQGRIVMFEQQDLQLGEAEWFSVLVLCVQDPIGRNQQ